jgi:hypothetical protein
VLTREFLQSPMAKPIFAALASAQQQAYSQALRVMRDGTKPYEQARYQTGIGDGIGRAINLLEELRKAQDG